MIISCDECTRQYRVDRYEPGQRLRCMCGNCMTVPEPDARAHVARVLHCADCGGPLAQGAMECGYCGGAIDPRSQELTLICPSCFARLPEGARFCIECAQPIRPQEVLERTPLARSCPRCATPLQARGLESIGFEECPKCLGLWLCADAFKAVCERKLKEYHENPLPVAGRGEMSADPVSYIKCPDCGQIMNRENFGRTSGIIVDRCAGHGVWLDNTELERVARYIAEGGLARSRQREAADLERRARSAQRRSATSHVGTNDLAVSGVLLGAELSWDFLSVLGSLWD